MHLEADTMAKLMRFHFLLILLLAAMQPALAGEAVCTLSSATLNYGVYSPGAAQDGAVDLDVTCTAPDDGGRWVCFNIGVRQGLSNNYTNRQMHHTTATANLLNNQLYVDSARSQIWGDFNTGYAQIYGQMELNNGLPKSRTVTVRGYGRIASGQSKPKGTYQDSNILMTLISVDNTGGGGGTTCPK